MKSILVFLLMVLMATTAFAAEQTRTFAWDEPTDLAIIERWEIYVGDTPGGPYLLATIVPKVEGQTVFQADSTVDIIGAPGSEQTRYFVILACGTVLEAGQPVDKCSGDSNEVNFSVDIPALELKVPVNFRMLPE